jgi:GT2 family glycosyltransferase
VICYSDYMKFYPKLKRSFMVVATGDLQQGMGLCHQAMLADRSAYELVGGFDPEFRLAADYEWVLRAKKAGVHFVKAAGPPTAVFRQGGMSDSQYRVSRAEAAKIIRREYGWPAYARYVATQRWRFCLRAASETFESLFGYRAANWLHVAYLRIFRGHRELHPADR